MLESLSDHPNVRDTEEQPPFTAVGVGDVTRAVHVTVNRKLTDNFNKPGLGCIQRKFWPYLPTSASYAWPPTGYSASRINATSVGEKFGEHKPV